MEDKWRSEDVFFSLAWTVSLASTMADWVRAQVKKADTISKTKDCDWISKSAVNQQWFSTIFLREPDHNKQESERNKEPLARINMNSALAGGLYFSFPLYFWLPDGTKSER